MAGARSWESGGPKIAVTIPMDALHTREDARQREFDEELCAEAANIRDTVRIDYEPPPASQRMVVDVPALTVVKILAILFAASLLQQNWPIITALTVSVMLAAALAPYLALLERYGMSRGWALTMVAVSLVLAFAAVVALLVGGRLLGMLGMLIALPLVAGLPVVLDFAGIHLRTGNLPRAVPDASQNLSL